MKKHLLFLILMMAGNALFAGHWTPVSAPYAFNMTITGVIQFYGLEQHADALEVGVFCGDECRGSQQPTYFAPADRYVAWITVYGEEGDRLSFKLYNHETDEELDLGMAEELVFNTDGYGSLSNPYMMNFKAMASPSQPQPVDVPITLVVGWNWISYLLGEEISLEEALADLTPAHGDMIKGQNANCTYDAATSRWVGSLIKMTPGQGYIYLNKSSETKVFHFPASGEWRVVN